MHPTNKLKLRLYRCPRIGNCNKPTVFPKYTFFSNESKCQHVLPVGYDEDQTARNRDSKMLFTWLYPLSNNEKLNPDLETIM
jgi:hypothetical protein